MATHEFRTLRAGLVGLALAAAFSAPAFAMDADEAQLIRHGWTPQTGPVYDDASLTPSADDALGFDDPRAGSSSYAIRGYPDAPMRMNAASADILGFTDPCPGDSSY